MLSAALPDTVPRASRGVMISSAPKLRTDLIVQERQTPDGRFFVVKEPASGNFFRIREAEHFIAQQLDGETPIEVVRRRTEHQFDTTLPAATLNAFITSLKAAGLLHGDAAPTTQPAGRRWRLRGNPLYLRFKLFDPDRLFTRLGPWVRPCFTPHFLVLSAALILLAIGTATANWHGFILDFSRLYRFSTVWLVLAVSFLVVSAHEFAHGLTCKYFGGAVRELGFMLIYFQPALYCNVSDAWLFPKTSTRLWVGVSGPYFELVLWALATLLWRVTDRETWINYLALIVMATSGIKTCFNLNPLIKLDGYYLLSDYLEIPNLRARAFSHVGTLIMRLFGSARRTEEDVAPRERRIYLIYGVAALAGSLSLLGYIGYLATASGYLAPGRGSAIAVLLSACIVVMKVRRRFRRLFGRSSAAPDPDDFDDSEGTPTPGSSEPAPGGSTDGSPRRRRLAWTALTATGALLFLVPRELRIPAAVDVLPSQNADVRTAVEGIIEKVYVDEGNSVRAGDVIARLSDWDTRTELEKTKADIRDARAKLTLLEAGPNPEEVEGAKVAVSKAADQLRYAQSQLGRFRSLFAEGLVAQAEFEDKQQVATWAANDLEEAKRKLSALLSSIRPEQIEEAKAQIERLETQRRYLEEQLRLLTIVSPVTGVVATPSRQLKELPGQLIRKGDLVAKVYEMDTIAAQLVISEKDIADIRVGQGVALKVRAYPDETFQGTVTAIATSAQGSLGEPQAAGNPASADKTVLVTTEIDNHSRLLKPEMTGQAKIFCGRRRGPDLFMRRLARTFKVEFWGWW